MTFRATRWTPVADHNESYTLHHAEFLRCILRQLNGHAFPVLFPLTPVQLAACLKLSAYLEDPETDEPVIITAVQDATWAIMSEASNLAWSNVHQVYFALLALRMDGTYASSLALTPHLAKFHYMMRVACLFTAVHLPVDQAVS